MSKHRSPREEVGVSPPTSVPLSFLVYPLEAVSLPELADALESENPAIVAEWVALLKALLNEAANLPFGEIQDSVPQILTDMAAALRSPDEEGRRALLQRSPQQGITRFQQHYNVRDLMVEDRILRRLIILHVEAKLKRGMTQQENISLNTVIDVMLQQSVVAFVEHQAAQVHAAAEAELKYLSFLSHDLNNHLSNVTVWLQVLRADLLTDPDTAEHVDTIDSAQQAILTTVGGMGKLLQAERLRKRGMEAKSINVNLRTLVANETRQYSKQAERKDLRIIVDVPSEPLIQSDPELLTLVLQNLIGNAVKYAVPGTIHVVARYEGNESTSQWLISVTDEGPGIAPQHLERIFDAFRRADIHGQVGIGLGLAIASQAAKLLGGKLSVESTVGRGSTFTLTLRE